MEGEGYDVGWWDKRVVLALRGVVVVRSSLFNLEMNILMNIRTGFYNII